MVVEGDAGAVEAVRGYLALVVAEGRGHPERAGVGLLPSVTGCWRRERTWPTPGKMLSPCHPLTPAHCVSSHSESDPAISPFS